MRAVAYAGHDTVEVVERATPEIAADEVLLRVGGAGICHSDLTLIGMTKGNPLTVGDTLGHEIAGTVERVGDAVQGWRPGERALVATVLSCGQCRECFAGRDNQCEIAAPRDAITPRSLGIGATGGMADFLAINARFLDPIGDLDPVAAAPLADAALTPMHAIASVRERLTGDATVAVIGLGGLGHMALQILAASTAARVIALDIDPMRLESAKAHGSDMAIESDEQAAASILEATNGLGADVVLDFVGAQPTVELAARAVRVGGAIRFVGLGGGTLTYVSAATRRLPWGVNIERAYGGTRAEMREVIALAQRGKITVDIVRYPLDDAVQAFDDLRHGRIRGRAVLVP